jgi:hypothetical protein
MTRRINARLPPELAEKLAELRRRTGKSVTDLLQDALESYYEASRATDRPAALLADFVACMDGPPGLSSTYKKDLRRSLVRKVRRTT